LSNVRDGFERILKPNLKYYPRFLGETEENHGKPRNCLCHNRYWNRTFAELQSEAGALEATGLISVSTSPKINIFVQQKMTRAVGTALVEKRRSNQLPECCVHVASVSLHQLIMQRVLLTACEDLNTPAHEEFVFVA
jgi:hypothetical protein